MKHILTSILALGVLTSYAQNPAPARPQERAIALTGATIHVGNGQVSQNGVVGFV